MKVNLTKRVSVVTPEGTTMMFCPVVYVTTKGRTRIKSDYILIRGQQEHRPDGTYYLDWYDQNKKRQRERLATTDAATAEQERFLKEVGQSCDVQVVRKTETVMETPYQTPVVPIHHSGLTIEAASKKYLIDIKNGKAEGTSASYTRSGALFFQSLKVMATKERPAPIYLRELTQVDSETKLLYGRDDMLNFMKYLRTVRRRKGPKRGEDTEYILGYEERTIEKHVTQIATFFKKLGLPELMIKGDRPTPTDDTVEIYEPEEVQQLLRASLPKPRMYFEFFLNTGERDQEVTFTMKRDLFLTGPLPYVKVSYKPEYRWAPKMYKARDIPISVEFAKKLKAYLDEYLPNAHPGSLLFPTESGKPKRDFLTVLKRSAKAAGLNCKGCDACKQRKECQYFWLHKFRATFACTHLEPSPSGRAGVSVPTLQLWMGHSDLGSTQKYVRASKDLATRASVNEAFSAFG